MLSSRTLALAPGPRGGVALVRLAPSTEEHSPGILLPGPDPLEETSLRYHVVVLTSDTSALGATLTQPSKHGIEECMSRLVAHDPLAFCRHDRRGWILEVLYCDPELDEIQKEAGLFCRSFLRKGEMFTYVRRIQKQKDLRTYKSTARISRILPGD